MVNMDLRYIIRMRVQTWTHGFDMDSWYWQRLIVWT